MIWFHSGTAITQSRGDSMRKSLLLMAVGTLVAATSSGSLFSVTEHTIAAPSNFSFTFAWGLNETHVAGYAHGQFTYNGSAYAANRAFRWSEASGFEVLGTLGGAFPWSHALAISAEGTVVGSSSALSLYNPSANRQTAYRTSATGAMTALPLPPSVAAG
jgi:uncharacterized membrane protein